MRALFGLVGLLVAVGVLVWWLGAPGGGLDQTQATLKAGENAREQLSQVGGIDRSTGRSVMTSAELEGLNSNGRVSGLHVNSVEPEGAYAKYFGLQKDDTITAVIYSGFRQTVREIGDEEMAKAQVSDAYSKHGQIVVKRNNTEITLPAPPSTPDTAAAPAPEQKKDSLQSQLDAIQSVR